jgi:hypothetical protein
MVQNAMIVDFESLEAETCVCKTERVRGDMFEDVFGSVYRLDDINGTEESSSEDELYSEDESEEDSSEVETVKKIENRGFMGRDLRLEVHCDVPNAYFSSQILWSLKQETG